MALKIAQIQDNQIWDKFIINHNFWSFFQSWHWGQLHQLLGNKLYRLGLYKDQQLLALAQIIVVKAKRGKFLHIRHGPVFQEKYSKIIYWKNFINEIKKLAVSERTWFIRISPMMSDSPANEKLLSDLGFRVAPIQAMDAEVCWVLELNKSEPELLSNMRKTTRNLIRQAQKQSMIIEESNDIDRFLKLYVLTYHRHKFIPHQGIREEFEVFSKQKQAKLLIAKHNEQDLAGAIILFFGPQAIYHHGASIKTKIPVNYLLQWEAIRIAKNRGCQYYNFWGIAPDDKPNHPWKGITMFKKGFGGEVKQFLHVHDLALSNNYWITYIIETARRWCRGY